MQTEEPARKVALHCGLVVPDICFVDDQVHDLLGCGPLGGLLGDVSTKTPGVVVQAGPVLGDETWDLETWEERTEVYGEAFSGKERNKCVSCGLI